MKKEEIIELGGNEYTLTLNRESYVTIDKYCNIQESSVAINSPLINHVDEIQSGTNPFEQGINIDKYIDDSELKLKKLKKMICVGFWVWLYPNHKIDYDKVCELIEPYFENSNDISFISEQFGKYLAECNIILSEYENERKNLKALANK